MISTMSIVCTQCGYENSEHYRFCGMCGALLPPPRAQAAPPAPARPDTRNQGTAPAPFDTAPPQSDKNVSGPSFLGLSEQPSRGAEYLLEDEESHDAGRRRMYAALLILVIAGIVVMWHWRQAGFTWIGRITAAQNASGPPVQNNSSLTNGPPVQAGATTGPSPSVPMASSSATTSASSTPPPATPSDESHMVNPEANRPAGEAVKKPTEEKTGENQNASAEDAQDAGTETPASAAETSEPAPAPSKPAAAQAAKTTPKTIAPKTETTPPAASLTGDAKLVADGEKYLYGTGAPENCALADKNLRAAAAHSNPKALSMLGAMSATGHCATRDLPTAYRWFARALHRDPNNGRIQRDLEVLWRQMSAEERQSAIKSQ